MLIARNGVERRISGTVAPIRDHHGHVSGAVIAFGGEPSATETEGESLPGSADTEVVVHSQVMQDLMKFAAWVASSGVSCILLQGESGTGKYVIARFLHQSSRRSEKPFISINCAAIPETLVESDLFGYEKGAFTDARSQKRGVLELAHSGTIFLDEIGELQLHLQTKLLRVLEEQVFRRLGGIKDVSVDLRVITATNKNLAEAVQHGEFREDLFYRLNVIHIRIPRFASTARTSCRSPSTSSSTTTASLNAISRVSLPRLSRRCFPITGWEMSASCATRLNAPWFWKRVAGSTKGASLLRRACPSRTPPIRLRRAAVPR